MKNKNIITHISKAALAAALACFIAFTATAQTLPEGLSIDNDFAEGEAGYYYVNMPEAETSGSSADQTITISDTKYFPLKIYDGGGKNNKPKDGRACYLTINAPEGYKMNISGTLAKSTYEVELKVFDYKFSEVNIWTTPTLASVNAKYNASVNTSSTDNVVTIYFCNGAQPKYKGDGINLTVKLLPIEYTITYNGIDGATFATTNPSSYTVESDEITIANPTRDGYTFLGWTDDPTTIVTIPKGSIGNKEFIANWQQKFGALTLVYAGNRTTATLQGEFTSTETTSLNIENQIEVNELTFQRTFKAGVPATIMLPFDFIPDDNVGKFYTLTSVAPINGVWTATMSNPINGIIKANTPCIFMPTKDITPSNYMTFTDITLKPTIINDNGSGDWKLHGVYEKTQLDGFNQVNYGFAGQATDDISVGDFIRAGEGVWADPMRCYLTYNKNNGVLAKSAIDLPDRIRVVFPDEVEQPDKGEIVTPVSEIATEFGVKVWSFDGTVYIEAQPDMDYTIVDLTGRTIKKGITHSTHEELNLNTKGIVIVKIGNKSFKIK